MDITVYLPDEIGARAKEANLNMSRTLRDAVTRELERLDAIDARLPDEPETFELDLEDRQGFRYTGRVTGRRLAEDGFKGTEIFLAEDGRLLVYYRGNLEVDDLGPADEVDEDELREIVRAALPKDDGLYVEVMDQLGVRAVIDL